MASVFGGFCPYGRIIGWVILGQLVLNLHNPWVGLVALTTFGAVYNGNLADAPKVWIGSAVALLIAYLLWYVPWAYSMEEAKRQIMKLLIKGYLEKGQLETETTTSSLYY